MAMSHLITLPPAVRYYAHQMYNETQKRLSIKTFANIVCMVR
jgi:hypothetical protein